MMTVTRNDPALGELVNDVDLARLTPAEVADVVRDGLARAQVLVFRGQSFSASRHHEIVSVLGPVVKVNRDGGEDGVMYVSNRSIQGQLAVLPEGEMDFHSDLSYTPTPVAATTLYAVQVSRSGGSTRFVSAEDAYARLSPELRRRVARLFAVHGYNYGLSPGIRTTSDLASGARSHTQPVVVSHPVKGRPVLYVNRLMTRFLQDCDRDESDGILDELFEVIEAGPQYEHVWEPGDFVCWDNISVQHARSGFPAQDPRILRRISVEGTELSPFRSE